MCRFWCWCISGVRRSCGVAVVVVVVVIVFAVVREIVIGVAQKGTGGGHGERDGWGGGEGTIGILWSMAQSDFFKLVKEFYYDFSINLNFCHSIS